jgi:hypothetical protein
VARKRRNIPEKVRISDKPANTPWGRVQIAFTLISDHVTGKAEGSVLLAAGTAQTFVNMHSACEHYLPQMGGWRVAGVWFFPNKSRLRVERVSDIGDLARISSRRFSLIATHAEAEAVMLLEPLLLPDGQIIPFLGHR